ncbi:hypothetical protein ACGFIG_09405 [Micromonospora sp. NPDC049048]|uniref:hypothetical protein n=1 Tax=Micromonospora sp. NPDC049048 TaxID=3364263 RepID=UPI003715ED81
MALITAESDARARQLCNRLALQRLVLGLTQRDLAAHLGDQQGNVQVLETAKRRPLLPTFISYAWALGLDVALVAEHHLPLLDLTADEIRAIAVNLRGWLQLGDDPLIRSALTKLGATDVAADDLDADTWPADYPLDHCQPGDPTARPVTTVHLPAADIA